MATSTPEVGNRAHRFNRDDGRWRLVEEVLASSGFTRSPRLSSFLLYICEMTLDGRQAELNERAIGIQVFGRPASFHPGDDSIVRSQARLLRGRLEQYFLLAGSPPEWRLTVPKGSYVPVFERLDVAPMVAAQPRQRALWWIVAGCCSLLAVLLAVWLGLRLHRQESLWSTLFQPNRPTVIVPADGTLAAIEGRSPSPALLSDYLKHNYPEPPAGTPWRMNDWQLTSIADLKLAVRMARLPQAGRGQLEVRYPRDLTVHDARESNLILIGGVRANPWVQLFTGQIHFQIQSDRVSNSSPHGGEASSYSLDLANPARRSYGIVALLPGLAGGNTLLVEGSDMAGTEAAGEFLFDEAAFARVVGAGSVGHFEALLATTTLNGNASHFQVVAFHRIP